MRLTVQGERYRAIIRDFFCAAVDEIDLTSMWLQQESATCHTQRDTLPLLDEKFNSSVVRRNGDVNWQLKSCDLTPNNKHDALQIQNNCC